MNATKSWSSPWMRALWIEVASFGGEMTEETQGNLKLRVPMSRLEETEGLIKKLAERSCTIDIFCFSDGISCETRILAALAGVKPPAGSPGGHTAYGRTLIERVWDEYMRLRASEKASAEHAHTDECWEPDGGCDMGRNEAHVVVEERCEHGIPRRFCTAVHPTAEGSALGGNGSEV